jgi:hypothetical protein
MRDIMSGKEALGTLYATPTKGDTIRMLTDGYQTYCCSVCDADVRVYNATGANITSLTCAECSEWGRLELNIDGEL